MSNKPTSYQDAGVNIQQADELVKSIKKLAAKTKRPGILSGIGGFGALFEIPEGYQQPVLVSGTDGVGTKLKLATTLNKHDSIGIDLVAMCVNDILCLGAEPLFFLDYYATGQLDNLQAQQIVAGIADGCQQAGAALIGGETAEMPGMYHGDDYDLAGFCVGVVEKNKIIDGKRVGKGDALIALASSGPHSNGFSLIRHVIDKHETPLDTPIGEHSLADTLLTPTRIYVKPVLQLLKQMPVHALAHITGGGLIDNIPRVLPADLAAVIDSKSWAWPEIFHWLQSRGNIADKEMLRTFNVGVGMVICVAADDLDAALQCLTDADETAWHIGHVDNRNNNQAVVLA